MEVLAEFPTWCILAKLSPNTQLILNENVVHKPTNQDIKKTFNENNNSFF